MRANTLTYEVNSIIALIYKSTSNALSILTILKKGSKIEVISISNNWAYFIYNGNNAYIKTSNIKLVATPVIKGSITIKYIDIDSNISILNSVVYENLELKSYTYSSQNIDEYKLYNNSNQSVTLTQSNPNQTITFLYKKVLGSVTVKYIDVNTNLEISSQNIYSNLTLGSYTYTAKEFDNYNISNSNTQSVTLTQNNTDQIITFTYEKVASSITINYINIETEENIIASEAYSNLELKTYTYTAKEIDGYKVYGDATKTITLTSDKQNQTITFYYQEILGSITIKYIDSITSQEISTPDTYDKLPLLSYTYTAKDINFYEIIEPKSKSAILTETDANQTITFSYKKIVGDIIIKYVDSNTGESILDDKVYSNLSFGSYTYAPISIDNYEIVEDNTKSVILNESKPNQIITFYYKKMIGSITIKYINKYIMTDISNSIVFDNLALGEYIYNSKVIDGYTLIGENTKTVNLTDTNPIQTVVFEYKVAEDVNIDEHPYISTRYVTPTWDINDDIILNFYVTDWNQSDVVYEKFNIQFNVEFKINDVVKIYTKSIGENSINIGKLEVGEYEYIIQATDEYGRKSHELYNEFRVIDKEAYELEITNNTHIVTEEDLVNYGITKGEFLDNTEYNRSIAQANKLGLQNLMNDDHDRGIRKIILPTDTYTLNVEGKWAPGVAVQYSHNVLTIPSYLILDLNGSTINQVTSTPDQKVNYLLSFIDSYDSHVINGTLEGDYGRREFTCLEGLNYLPGEQCACACIGGESKYSSFDNITVKKYPGYAMTAGMAPQGSLNSNGKGHAILGEMLTWEPGEINTIGELIDSNIKYTTQFLNLSKFKNINTIRIGQYLGYLYQPHGDSLIAKYSFYDENKQFIKTITGHQYRDIRKPDNSMYLRVTQIFNKFTNMNNMQIYYMYSPRNCGWYNCKFEDTRTCALAPYQGNNMMIDNCKFYRCATNITPVAIDFEDGWHNMQDYCIQNSEIVEPVGTGDLVIVGGFDLLFRNNKNWRISSRSSARGQTFINNELESLNLGRTTHRMSAFLICKNNITNGFLDNTLGTLSDIKFVIDSCTFNDTGYQKYNEKIIVRDCTFNWNSKTIQYRSPILGGTFYRCIFNDFICSLGHIANFIAYNSIINNMQLEALQGDFILYDCKVNGCSFSNYTLDINIDINNSVIRDFIINRQGWAKCNINYTAKNNIFENTNTRKNILIDDYRYFDNTKLFKVITLNNTYLNNTILANTVVLTNPNIDFSQMSN